MLQFFSSSSGWLEFYQNENLRIHFREKLTILRCQIEV